MESQKYLFFFKKILNKDISIRSPNLLKSKIIVLDGVAYKDLENIITGLDTKLLETRSNRLNTLYISLFLFFKLFINLFKLKKKHDFLTIYLFTLLDYLKPKVVLTFIDNAGIFFNLAKMLEKKITFIAIQNAARYDFIRNKLIYEKGISSTNPNQNFYIPHYVTFGKYEKDLSSDFNIEIKNFYNFGSLRLANFLEYSNQKKIKFKKYKYDICLVSEPAYKVNEMYGVSSVESGIARLAKFTIKFSIENKKKLVFIKKREKGNALSENETKFYKDYLNEDEYNYLIKNSVEKSDTSSYHSMLDSEVVIATQSTLLREKLGFGEKILATNLTNHSGYEFPIDGICKIESCDYQYFADRLKKIFDLQLPEYFKLITKEKDYIMTYDESFSTINKIRKLIKSFLQENSK